MEGNTKNKTTEENAMQIGELNCQCQNVRNYKQM
jgi:hypothetical protein